MEGRLTRNGDWLEGSPRLLLFVGQEQQGACAWRHGFDMGMTDLIDFQEDGAEG